MVDYDPESREVAMALLGEGIPAIGPRLNNRAEAIKTVRRYMGAIERMVKDPGMLPYTVIFARQSDGRYKLVIKGPVLALEINNVDELMVKRFQKSFIKGLFIITSFFEDHERLECLALTEGLGAVLYSPR